MLNIWDPGNSEFDVLFAHMQISNQSKWILNKVVPIRRDQNSADISRTCWFLWSALLSFKTQDILHTLVIRGQTLTFTKVHIFSTHR